MGNQSEKMIRKHDEDEAIDHFANILADKFKDSGELADINDKRLIVIAYWEGYEHGKKVK